MKELDCRLSIQGGTPEEIRQAFDWIAQFWHDAVMTGSHTIPPAPDFDRAKLQQQMAELAGKGVFIGTPSWKYP